MIYLVDNMFSNFLTGTDAYNSNFESSYSFAYPRIFNFRTSFYKPGTRFPVLSKKTAGNSNVSIINIILIIKIL